MVNTMIDTAQKHDVHSLPLKLSLLVAATAGFGLGLALFALLVWRLPFPVPWPALAQLHGQAQMVGFIGLFILGTGAQIFPRFLLKATPAPWPINTGAALIVVGLVCRVAGQLAVDSPLRPLLLALAGLLQAGGIALAVAPFLGLARRTIQPSGLWLPYPVLGLTGLALAQGANLWGLAALAGGELVVPGPRDELLVHLELWGFAVPIVLGVSLRLFPRFLILRPPRGGLFRPALAVYALGLLLGVAGYVALDADPTGFAPWLVAAGAWLELGALGAVVAGLRLFETPQRASGAPHVTEPTRLWVRLAYAWLLVGSLLGACAALHAALDLEGGPLGLLGGLTGLVSGSRHAVAQGCLFPLIVGLGARMLPGYSAVMPGRPRLLAGLMNLLFLAALLRVLGEVLRAATPWGVALAAVGGLLGTVGFSVFAATLWPTLVPRDRRWQLESARAPRRPANGSPATR